MTETSHRLLAQPFQSSLFQAIAAGRPTACGGRRAGKPGAFTEDAETRRLVADSIVSMTRKKNTTSDSNNSLRSCTNEWALVMQSLQFMALLFTTESKPRTENVKLQMKCVRHHANQ